VISFIKIFPFIHEIQRCTCTGGQTTNMKMGGGDIKQWENGKMLFQNKIEARLDSFLLTPTLNKTCTQFWQPRL